MVNVTTECLIDVADGLNRSANALYEASESARRFVSNAGQALAGAQYSLSVSETEAACRVMEESASSMIALSEHITELNTYIEEYLSCTYSGS